jgi:DNA-binding IclR family transcriptional regulator
VTVVPAGSWASSGLRRDLDVLRELASDEALHRGGLGVVRVAERLGREKSQVSRALRALEAEGLVERDPESRTYQLGWALYALAARTTDARLARQARPFVRAIAGELGQTTHLCVLSGGLVLTVLTEAGPDDYRATGWEGRTVAVTETSAGPALLFDWTTPSVLRHLGDSTEVHPRAATPAGWLLDEIERVRRYSYAVADLTPEAIGVSAPVQDFRRTVRASLTVSARREAVGPDAGVIGKRVVKAAEELSRRLGFDPTDVEP